MLTGIFVPNRVETPRATTIQDLADRIESATEGRVTLEIAPDGQSLRLNGNGETVTILAGDTGSGGDLGTSTLESLGFTESATGATVDGGRVLSSFRSVLLDSINGGAGLGGGELTVTDRNGASFTVTGLTGLDTLEELVDTVNTALSGAGVDVSFGLDSEGLRLIGTDTSGGAGALTVTGSAAESLGLDETASGATLRGDNLQRGYVTSGTLVSELRQGRGLGTGEFQITDSNGVTATIDIDTTVDTVQELLDEINAAGLDVRAQVNANGDGVELVDTNLGSPITALTVTDTEGNVADALGIAGTASAAGEGIVGSEAITIDVDPSDTLNDIVTAINEAGVPLAATLLNTGGGARPYFLSLTSEVSGRRGDLIIDTGAEDISFSTLVEAQDAQVFVGSADPREAILVTSSDNTLQDFATGVDLDLRAETDAPVQIEVQRDDEGIRAKLQEWVDTFNEVIDKINQYDSYDQETERRGALLGDGTVATVRSGLYRVLQQSASDVDGEFSFLSEVGIRIAGGGRIEFDESKFTEAWERNSEDVKKLFTTFEIETVNNEQVSEGISIARSETNYVSLGFGDLFDRLLDSLTNSVDGTMTLAETPHRRAGQFQRRPHWTDRRSHRIATPPPAASVRGDGGDARESSDPAGCALVTVREPRWMIVASHESIPDAQTSRMSLPNQSSRPRTDRASAAQNVVGPHFVARTTSIPYLRTKVMTASPAELRLMLLDGAVRFADDARAGLRERDYERSYEGFTRAQAIVMELIASLNPQIDPELCSQLSGLYTYIFNRLVTGSMERDVDAVTEALDLLRYEQETWRMLIESLAGENQAASSTGSFAVRAGR